MGDQHPHGIFGWCDLAVPDAGAASSFYSALFGWEPEETPGGFGYTMFTKDGHYVAGVGELSTEDRASGVPPVWSSYVAVDDVEAIAAAVTQAGGTIMFGPMPVGPAGSMLFATDPTGASIGFWQGAAHKGAGLFNVSGAMSWNELMTRDIGAAMTFYSKVLGWKYEPIPLGGATYQLVKHDQATGGDNAGIMEMDEKWPVHVPSHWMVYFTTDDIDVTVTTLQELGGSVSVPTFDTQVGRIAVVADNQCGTFSLIQPATHEAGD